VCVWCVCVCVYVCVWCVSVCVYVCVWCVSVCECVVCMCVCMCVCCVCVYVCMFVCCVCVCVCGLGICRMRSASPPLGCSAARFVPSHTELWQFRCNQMWPYIFADLSEKTAVSIFNVFPCSFISAPY